VTIPHTPRIQPPLLSPPPPQKMLSGSTWLHASKLLLQRVLFLPALHPSFSRHQQLSTSQLTPPRPDPTMEATTANFTSAKKTHKLSVNHLAFPLTLSTSRCFRNIPSFLLSFAWYRHISIFYRFISGSWMRGNISPFYHRW
jgi:hypothetical protein